MAKQLPVIWYRSSFPEVKLPECDLTIHTHTETDTQKHAHIHTHINTETDTRTHTQTHTNTHTQTHTHTTHTHTHKHTPLHTTLRLRMNGAIPLPIQQAFTARRGTRSPLSLPLQMWAGIAQSVLRLATDWTPGDRIPVGARFFAPVQTGPGAHLASCTMGNGSFLGVKRPGRGVDHPPQSNTEVKGRVGLYFCSHSGSM